MYPSGKNDFDAQKSRAPPDSILLNFMNELPDTPNSYLDPCSTGFHTAPRRPYVHVADSMSNALRSINLVWTKRIYHRSMPPKNCTKRVDLAVFALWREPISEMFRWLT